MPRANPGDPPMIQCRKCGRAVWSSHVNTRGNCALCSPPHDESQPDAVEPVNEPAAPAEAPAE